MIDNKSVLAVIPARGGSKGVPRKNIRNVAGKPLIAWTIEEAKKSRYIDRLIVSSEDEEIIQVARQFDCEVPFIRPQYLAEDNTPGIEPVLHAIEEIDGYDLVVLLQPTSPLRTVEDIDGCLQRCIETKANSCVTVTEVDKSPYWMYKLNESNIMLPFLTSLREIHQRQELDELYVLNGAVYVANIEWLKITKKFISDGTVAFKMEKEKSIDIDSVFDLKLAELLLKL